MLWVRIGWTEKSRGSGIGGEPSSAKTPFHLLVLLLTWFHGLTGKVCSEIRGFVCHPYDVHRYSEIIS